MKRPLRVAIDFNSPAAYLAVAPTRALESRLAVEFEWLPFPAVQWARSGVIVSNEDRSARHFRMRTEYLASDLRRYAEARGIDLGDLHRNADATAACLGLLWLHRRHASTTSDYIDRIFDRIWRENAEPDLAFVETSLGPVAAGFRGFAEAEGSVELEAMRVQLSNEGVWDVPAYLVGGELFIGRQHLPLVERLATDESRDLAGQ